MKTVARTRYRGHRVEIVVRSEPASAIGNKRALGTLDCYRIFVDRIDRSGPVGVALDQLPDDLLRSAVDWIKSGMPA